MDFETIKIDSRRPEVIIRMWPGQNEIMPESIRIKIAPDTVIRITIAAMFIVIKWLY